MDGLLRRFRRGTVWPAAVVILVLVGAPTVADSFPGPGSGPVPDPHTGPTTARIGLSGVDPEGLRQFAEAVSDPRHAEYRHFLTPQQVKARFGPTPEQVKNVHDWVAAAGLKVTDENTHWVDVAGTPQQVAKAFTRGMVKRRGRWGGTLRSQAAATVPPDLTGVVSSVAGLVPQQHGMRQFSHRLAPSRRPNTGNGDGSGIKASSPTPPSVAAPACSSSWDTAPAT